MAVLSRPDEPERPPPRRGKRRRSVIDKSVLALSMPRRIGIASMSSRLPSSPVLVCGRRPADAHHLRFAQSPALGRKVSDEFTVPLRRGRHHGRVRRFRLLRQRPSNYVRAFLRDHDRRCMNVRRWNGRHNGCVDDSQPLDAANTQLAVHHSVVALTHPASAAGMMGGRARFPNVIGDFLFVYDVQTRRTCSRTRD